MPIIKIDNVVQYVYDHFDEKFNAAPVSIFPCLKLSFPVVWIESDRPERFAAFSDSDGCEVPAGFPRSWGWRCIEYPASEINHPEPPEGARFMLEAELVKLHIGDDRPHGPYCVVRVFTDACGVPIGQVNGSAILPDLASEDDDEGCQIDWQLLGVPAFLAISFMNCKNVTTTTVDSDAKLNRERRKHGLTPFLRYHTINIEPMKKVLRTKGQSETEELKRALHICRGHFSTYTEDRPLFGKVAGTFWVSSRVRGTAKEGIVVSDYQIRSSSPVKQKRSGSRPVPISERSLKQRRLGRGRAWLNDRANDSPTTESGGHD
jgi:hypothetical protein